MFKSMGRAWRAACLALAIGGVPIAAQADINPPDGKVLDANGVDLATGHLNKPLTLLTIGDPKAGGLSWSFSGTDYVSDSYSGLIQYWGQLPAGVSTTTVDQIKVVLAGSPVSFYSDCSVATYCVNANGGPETLVKSGSTYLFTDKDGTVYTFSAEATPNLANYNSPIQFIGKLLSITRPDGIVISLNYTTTGVGNYTLKSVVSNRGYALKYDSAGGKIYAVNMAAHSCTSDGMTCDAYDNYITLGNDTYTDSLGNTTTLSLDEVQTDAVDDVTYQYTLGNYQSPNGETISTTIDQYGRIKTLVTPAGTWTYAYSDNTLTAVQNTVNRTVTVKDPSGAIFMTAVVNKPNAFATSSTDALGHVTSYSNAAYPVPYNSGKYYYHLTTVAKPEGNSTTWAYDARGNITQETQNPKSGSGLSATNVYANYDGSCTNPVKCNKPNWTEDARGHYTYYTYDAGHGGVTLVQSPADANGVTPETVTSWSQYTAQIKNSSGALVNAGTIWLPYTTSTCASAATCNGTANQTLTTMAYSAANLVTASVTTAAGDNSVSATTSFTYDSVGNRTSVDGPRSDVNDVSYTTYDADRRPVYEIGVDPDGSNSLPRAVTHHIYTGLLETQTEAGTSPNTDGSSFSRASYATTSYDAMDHKTLTAAYIDGNGTAQSLTQFNYDNRERLNCTAVRMNPSVYGTISGTDACSLGTTSTTYGPDRITKNTYDLANQLTEVDQAYGVAGTQRAYARYYYNPNGTKLYEIDANTYTTQYAYDGFDRLQRIYYPCPATQNCADGNDYEEFGYDANGNKTSWRRRNVYTIAYTFDNLNRQTFQDVPVSPGNANGTDMDLTTAYDLLGHVKSKTLGNGQMEYYNYDALGRMTSTSDPAGRVNWYQYNASGGRTYLVMPDGHWVNYTLDAANRVTQAYHDVDGVLFTQGYDNLGRRNSLYRGGGGAGGQTTYGYDNLGRVTSLANAFATSTYNINWTFTGYNPAGQLLSTGSSSAYYDYKETANTTVNQTYDGLNRDAAIAAVSGGYDAAGNLTKDATRVMVYDAFNRLLSVAATSTPTSPYLTLTYDPEGRLENYTASGYTTTFGYDGSELIGEYSGSTILRQYVHGTGTDEPLVWFEGSAYNSRRYFFQDYHGSVVGLTDASGNLTDLYKYGPYGEPTTVANTPAWSGSRFRYTGQLMMFEAQLYSYKARIYDPVMGHFLQTDPIGSKDDLDLYAYTKDDPIDGSDPTGNEAACVTNGGTCGLGNTNNAPGVTVIIQGGRTFGAAAGPVGGGVSTQAGIAIDNQGTVKPVTSASGGPVVGAKVTGGLIVSVTVANGHVDDQKGVSVGGGGQAGPVSASVSHGTNTKGQDVNSVTVAGSPGAGGGGGPIVTTTHVIDFPLKNMDTSKLPDVPGCRAGNAMCMK